MPLIGFNLSGNVHNICSQWNAIRGALDTIFSIVTMVDFWQESCIKVRIMSDL